MELLFKWQVMIFYTAIVLKMNQVKQAKKTVRTVKIIRIRK